MKQEIDMNEELKCKINQIWDILQNAKESFYYSYYLHKPDTEDEQEYILTSNHFAFIKMTLWKVAVIELSKLFNKAESQDKFNLKKLLINLKPDGHFRKLNFNFDKISYWEKSFEINKETIKQIIDLRDKVYSHTDSNNQSIKNSNITFEKTEILIKLCEEIIITIYDDVFDCQAEMSLVNFDESFKEIPKILSLECKIRKENIFAEYKKYSQ